MNLSPRPIEATPLAHDRVYRRLRSRVMYGDLPPGQALTLRGIGKEYEVSMTAAREAVRRLVAEGAFTMSASGRISTPELSNERIEELAALRAFFAARAEGAFVTAEEGRRRTEDMIAARSRADTV